MSAEPTRSRAPRADAVAGQDAAAPRAPFRARLQQIRRAFRQMFGIPDFDRYREHMQAKHPDAPMLSEREFHAMAIDRRYGAARPRCC
jgi:uncharacterized short protein YbdD (DUF466 family)